MRSMKKLTIDQPAFAKERRHYLGRVHFFSRLEEIRIGIELGFPLATLHKQYKDVFQFSYSQFARYVTRYIKRPTPEAREACAQALKRQREVNKAKPAAGVSPPPTGASGFNYRNDTPKDELI